MPLNHHLEATLLFGGRGYSVRVEGEHAFLGTTGSREFEVFIFIH